MKRIRNEKAMRQYTLRNVSARVDEVLRRRARDEGKSLNQVALEALERGSGVVPQIVTTDAFDDLSGSWVADPECEAALDEMRPIDWENWE